MTFYDPKPVAPTFEPLDARDFTPEEIDDQTALDDAAIDQHHADLAAWWERNSTADPVVESIIAIEDGRACKWRDTSATMRDLKRWTEAASCAVLHNEARYAARAMRFVQREYQQERVA